MMNPLLVALTCISLAVETGGQKSTGREKLVKIGDNAYLECNGNAGTFCAWTKIEPNLSSRILVASGDMFTRERHLLDNRPEEGVCSLNITDVQYHDSADLSCEIGQSNQNFLWKLDVGTPPENIFISYQNKILDLNISYHEVLNKEGKVELKCVAEDASPKANVTWKGYNSLSEDKVTKSQFITTTNTLNINIDPLEQNPERNLTCLISHQLYSDIQTITVHIGLKHVPTYVNISGDSPFDIGSEVFCESDGIPVPNYRWKLIKPREKDATIVSISSNLTISEPGEYICEASNFVNATQWIPSAITIKIKEEITSTSKRVSTSTSSPKKQPPSPNKASCKMEIPYIVSSFFLITTINLVLL